MAGVLLQRARVLFWTNASIMTPARLLHTLARGIRWQGTARLSASMGVRWISVAVSRTQASLSGTTTDRMKASTDRMKASTGPEQNKLIWEDYKRNHKGLIPPMKTRLRCKRGDKICGNPCPICRNNIEINYRDTSLLEQFICPHTGQILEATKTGLCRLQQKNLVAAIEKAWDSGLLLFTIPRSLPEEEVRIPAWNKIDVR